MFDYLAWNNANMSLLLGFITNQGTITFSVIQNEMCAQTCLVK